MQKAATHVLDYTLIWNEKNKSQKIKRKMRKFILNKNFKFFTENSDIHCALTKICARLIRDKSQHPAGVILDNNVIVHDITLLPPVPDSFDILCLECDINKYKDTSDTTELIYWTPVLANSSGNFVINGNSSRKVLKALKDFEVQKETKNLWHFLCRTLSVFTITQYQLSETQENHIFNPSTKTLVKEITDKEIDLSIYSKWESKLKQVTREINLQPPPVLPKLSLITTFTNKDTFYNMMLTFQKLKYPRDLLELIIVDDTGSENKMDITEDSRIKLINLNGNGEKVPIGYLLNVGIKYATGSLIMHFFDFNIYNPKQIQNLVYHLMQSEKDCLMSIDTAVYTKNKSVIYKFPDLGNAIYKKSFWNNYSFEESVNVTQFNVIFNFIKYRTNLVSFIPFPFMSFKCIPVNFYISQTLLPFDLETIVEDSMKESFKMNFG
jgi:PIN domain nuclease of toxin-antitoxin system